MKVLSLDGAWEFRRVGEEEWLPATVPGTNFTDLLANGRIPDPFVADNEAKVQWVVESDWEYRRGFSVDEEMLAHEGVWLECEGLDTLATLWVNGRKVGTAENMFRPYRFEVKDLLRAGENEVRIRFRSPVAYGRERVGTEPVLWPGHSLPGGPFVRKSPCQFGWDWGPKLPPCGIWRSLRLVGRNGARLEEVHLRQRHRRGKVALLMRVRLERWRPLPLRVRVRVQHPDGTVQEAEEALGPRRQEARLRLEVENPRLWWPNGYGPQPLYTVQVTVHDGEGHLLDEERMRIGLRRLELRRRPDRYGESFTFVVNGIPIFAKGANWIPADSFPTRIAEGHYRHLLRSAAQAHMNMLRVWGGGFYEDERFYDLCDELGILVWQDFMFSCSVYPGNEEFVENVRQEVIANVRRLRHRPCLALWCGNNEMEWGWVDWGWSQRLPEEAKHAYDRMFHHLLPQWLAQEDPDTPYIPSSPTSFIPFQRPNAEERGDGHYWEVWHGRVPFTEYRKHFFRFQSEFGFQALPPLETVAAFAEPQDWNLTSFIMEHHQRHPAGNGLIVYYLTQNFRLPKDFPSWCYLSQVLQAEAIRYGVEHWRRNRHRVSGTLYWQLNDCWPVVSWSSVDYFGRWKALHYAACRFYAPVLLSAEEEGTRVALHVTNDTLEPFSGWVRWRLENLEGEPLAGDEIPFTAKPQANTCVARLNLERQVTEENRREVILVYELLSAGGEWLSGGVVPFVPNKHLALTDPGLTAELKEAGGEWAVTVQTQRLARFVEVKFEGLDVLWSDNFFDLPAGRERTITCPREEGWSREALQARLRVRSLWDSFAP